MSKSQQSLRSSLSNIMNNFGNRISHNDSLFLNRIYENGLDKYIARLKAIGFLGHQNVLDAGCGYGQWSLALAGLNKNVVCCDISPSRIEILKEITSELGISNIRAEISGIDILPYNDDSFDAIFVYSVIQLSPWKKVLSEFYRVLKPGGKIYLNANGSGWYMFLWHEEHNKADNYDPKAYAAKSFNDTIQYERLGKYDFGMSLIIEPAAMETELKNLGFTEIQIAAEGHLHLNSETEIPVPFLCGEYQGLDAVYEVYAIKPQI